MHDLLHNGIYAIINKNINSVYIGMTERNFLIRWTEHLIRIDDYSENKERLVLYLNEGTKFLILKKMNKTDFTTKDYYKYEYEAREFYLRKDWNVLSPHSYNIETEYSNVEKGLNIMGRYRKAVTHMAFILATVNSKHNNGSLILSKLYKQVNRKFGTTIESREGSSNIQKLKKEELEFMMLELYPRFYHKKLSIMRDKYRKMDIQAKLQI